MQRLLRSIFQVEWSQLLLCVSQFHSIGQYKVYQVYKRFDNNFQKISKSIQKHIWKYILEKAFTDLYISGGMAPITFVCEPIPFQPIQFYKQLLGNRISIYRYLCSQKFYNLKMLSLKKKDHLRMNTAPDQTIILGL